MKMTQMSVVGGGVSPGTIPVSHRTNTSELDKRIKITELVLRCVILCLGILAAVLVGTDTQVNQVLSVEKKAKFTVTDMKSLSVLGVANVLVAVYSLIQGFRCVVSMIRGSVLISEPIAWLIFSADQIVAYVMVAAVAVAALSAVFAKEGEGEGELQWVRVCNMYGKFCKQAGEEIVSALVLWPSLVFMLFLSFVCMVPVTKAPKKSRLLV